jgi:hypothetical protein
VLHTWWKREGLISVYSSSGYILACHCGGLGAITVQSVWDLWQTEWQWGRFSLSTSIFSYQSLFQKYSILMSLYKSLSLDLQLGPHCWYDISLDSEYERQFYSKLLVFIHHTHTHKHTTFLWCVKNIQL